MRIKNFSFRFLILFLILINITNQISAKKMSNSVAHISALDSTTVLHKKPLALKPLLGWNSYDSYRNHIGEKEALLNLETFAKKLAPYGYEYFVIDLGWYSENASIPGSIRPMNCDPYDFALDANGYPIGSKTYFPNGIKAIADRVHKLGVKFGLHMMRGMVRKAYIFNLPVKGTPYRMRDIADTTNICSWANFTYGVDMNKPGAQEYYDGLIEHLADMGVDFIKYDDIVPYPLEMEAIGKALAKCKREIVLSMSPGDETTPKNKHHYQWGHLLRITSDIWDSHASLNASFKRWRDWQGKAEPGFWPDMDMLCLGTLSGMIDPLTKDARTKIKPQDVVLSDIDSIFFRPSNFTQVQERTFITMRALCASPMFMGGCLIRSEQRVFDLITNNDILACNQNGICGTLQSEKQLLEIWRTPKVTQSSQGWIGIFNRSEKESLTSILTLKDMGLPKGSYLFRNIFTNEVFKPGKPITIGADDVVFLEYSIINK